MSDTGRSDSRNSRSSRTTTSTTATTSSSSKFNNLLAAKSVLGIDDSVDSSSRRSNSVSTVTSGQGQSASSSLISPRVGQSHMVRQGLGPPNISPSHYSRITGSSRGSSGRGNSERQLTLYSAREDKSSVASVQSSTTSSRLQSIQQRQLSNTRSTAYSQSSSARREMARGSYNSTTRGSIVSNTTTLDVGSEQDSFTGSSGSPSRRSNDNNSSMRSNLDSLTSSPPPSPRRNDHNNSSMNSNFSMSSKMVSSTYERKTTLGGEGEQLLSSITTRSGMRKQQFRYPGANGSCNGAGQQTVMSLHEHEEGASQSSTNNDDSLYASSLSKTSINDDNASYQPSTTSSFARFNEMRSLLMAITPMQLESLIIQIIDSNSGGQDNNSDSSSFISIVQRWESTSESSRKLKFRKDAQLIDMSLAEFKRYAKEIMGIEECASMEEAMDLFTLEFERLVSNNGRSADGQQSIITNEDKRDDDKQDSYNEKDKNDDTVNNNDDMQELNKSMRSTSSNYTDLVEGRATLQRSLRACTLPELRLIVERLNFHYDGNDKSELILLIENSMLPDGDMGESQQSSSNGIDDSQSSEFSRQSSSVQQHPRQQSFPPRGKKREKKLIMDFGDSNSDNYYPRQKNSIVNEEHTLNHCKVKFARDTKEDKSHLAPKREKEGGWRSFVVGSNVVTDDAEIDDDDGGERALVPRSRNGTKRSYDDDDDDDYDDMFETNQTKYRPRIGLPSLPKCLRGQKVRELFTIFLLIALVVGLSVGLTLKNKRRDTDPGYDSIRADPDDPIYESFQITKSPSMKPSLAVTPSLRPAVASDVAVFSISTPVPGQSSTKSPSQELVNQLTQQPALPIDVSQPNDEVQQLLCAASQAELEASCATAESCISNPCQPKKFCFPFTCTEATSSLESNSLPSPSPLAVLGTTSVPSTIVEVSTYQPTEALSIDEVYPLIGPVDEPGMRMILYGVSPFDQMGRTQYAMLTAAYVEQFYNSETKGEDAVQNIVYDVVTSISLEDGELLGGDSSMRVLQGSVQPGIIVTFTMTISYHTFSASIDLKTITNRPFYDEDMRASYLKYMVDASAVTHMGNILNVSPIFYGDVLPETSLVTIDLTPAPIPILDKDIEEIPSVPEQLVLEVTTYEPSVSTILITSTPKPSVDDIITLDPTPMDTTTMPTTTTRPSSTPSGEVMDSESSETPTYQPIEIITALDSDP